MTLQKGRPPAARSSAGIADVYKDDPYALDEMSPLKLIEEEARNSNAQDQKAGTIRKHTHDGNNSEILPFSGLSGFLRVVSAVPTAVPTTISEQIVIYSNAGTRRIYFYVIDSAGTGAWRYAALT